jgi:sulfofructose kinase
MSLAMDRLDVLCVGYACVDLNFETSHHPGPDEKLRASSMHVCGGGPAANAAMAIQRLGGSAGFIGYLGSDALGESHYREFHAAGVDTAHIVRGAAPTPIAAVTIKPNGDRSVVDYRSTSNLIESGPALASIKPRCLLTDGHQPLLATTLLDEARRAGIPSILDAGSLHDGTRMLYPKVDYLITSEKFSRELTDETDPRQALAALDGVAPFIAITCGAEGVYWQDESGQHHMPAFAIDPIDTTGAGDAFHGAFALGLAQSLPLRENLRRASACGALTCLKQGARSALPKREQVERLLRPVRADS